MYTYVHIQCMPNLKGSRVVDTRTTRLITGATPIPSDRRVLYTVPETTRHHKQQPEKHALLPSWQNGFPLIIKLEATHDTLSFEDFLIVILNAPE